MTDTITLTGFVATVPNHLVTGEGLPITSFRLASTHRRFDRSRNLWVDNGTNWYTVTSFRQLALTSRNQAFVWWADMPAALLVRYLPEHALFFALQVVSRLFQGGLLPLLAGKAQALGRVSLLWRLRRDAQSRRRPGALPLRSALEARWLRPGIADFRRRFLRSDP